MTPTDTILLNKSEMSTPHVEQKEVPSTVSPFAVTFKAPEELALFIRQLYIKGVPRKKVNKVLTDCKFLFDTSHIDTNDVIDLIIEDVYSGLAFKGEAKELNISYKELDFILQHQNQHSDLVPKHPNYFRDLLFALLVYSRFDDYETGWINYNRKRIFDLAGLSRLSEAKKNSLDNFLSTEEIVKLRVVGTKKPILCYKLPWRDVDDISDERRATCFTLSPEMTSKEFIKQIDDYIGGLDEF